MDLARPKIKTIVPYLGLTFCLIIVTALFSTIYIPAPDWYDWIRPGVISFWQGSNPYDRSGFGTPFWAAILLYPFTIFPENINRGLLATATLVSVIVAARRFGAKPLTALAILLSPPVLQMLI